MEVLRSKWIILLLVVLAILIVLLILGNKSVHHEITIEAEPDAVWEVLDDTEKYGEWNPVMLPLEGTLKEEQIVKYQFTQDENNQSVIPAKVQKIIPGQLLNQDGGIPLILTYNHKYILEKVDGATKVIIHEDYKGIAVPFWDPEPVAKAYGRLNEALKDRVMELQ